MQVVEQFRLAALLVLEDLASQLEPLWQHLRWAACGPPMCRTQAQPSCCADGHLVSKLPDKPDQHAALPAPGLRSQVASSLEAALKASKSAEATKVGLVC